MFLLRPVANWWPARGTTEPCAPFYPLIHDAKFCCRGGVDVAGMQTHLVAARLHGKRALIRATSHQPCKTPPRHSLAMRCSPKLVERCSGPMTLQHSAICHGRRRSCCHRTETSPCLHDDGDHYFLFQLLQAPGFQILTPSAIAYGDSLPAMTKPHNHHLYPCQTNSSTP